MAVHGIATLTADWHANAIHPSSSWGSRVMWLPSIAKKQARSTLISSDARCSSPSAGMHWAVREPPRDRVRDGGGAAVSSALDEPKLSRLRWDLRSPVPRLIGHLAFENF